MRRPGRPPTRWRKEFEDFRNNWKELAQDRDSWKTLGETFAQQWDNIVRCRSSKMMSRLAGWLLLTVFLGHTFASPLCYHEAEARPLAAVSELGQRLAARAHPPEAGSSAGAAAEQRLALPTPQDLEAIKKVAQILVMLGEQVIPSIIGDSPVVVPPAHVISYGLAPPDEVPNDPLDEN